MMSRFTCNDSKKRSKGLMGAKRVQEVITIYTDLLLTDTAWQRTSLFSKVAHTLKDIEVERLGTI